MSRFPAAHLYSAVYNLHNSGQPSKVWCTHWLDWKMLLASGKHINRNSIYSCWDCFDTYCHQGHLGHESWSESAFSCVNLTSSKELREYLNAFCYRELGSYTVFQTAGVAVLECQRWTGFFWSRKLFIAWTQVVYVYVWEGKGDHQLFWIFLKCLRIDWLPLDC